MTDTPADLIAAPEDVISVALALERGSSNHGVNLTDARAILRALADAGYTVVAPGRPVVVTEGRIHAVAQPGGRYEYLCAAGHHLVANGWPLRVCDAPITEDGRPAISSKGTPCGADIDFVLVFLDDSMSSEPRARRGGGRERWWTAAPVAGVPAADQGDTR